MADHTLRCTWCDRPFTSIRRTTRYCGNRCRSAAGYHERRRPRRPTTRSATCEDCGVVRQEPTRAGPPPARCPPCRDERLREWDRHSNALARAERRRDPDRVRARDRATRERRWATDPDARRRQLAAARAWNDMHREVMRAANARYQRAHPLRAREAVARRAARKRVTAVETIDVEQVFSDDAWRCRLCYDPVDRDLRWPHPLSASLDHRTPLALGGTHTRENVQLAHLACNIRKGARSVMR